MSETNLEEAQQNENNFEYNENELQIDQNHEEDAEVPGDGEKIINPEEEELPQTETNEINQEDLNQQYANQEEENQFHDQNNEEENGNEQPELEHEEQELEHEEQYQENEDQNQQFENDEQDQELENEEQQNEEQKFDNEEEEQDDSPMIINENREKDITEMSIQELRAELEKSISQLDFVRAQSIQEEIDGRSTQNHSQFLDDMANKFASDCNKIARKHYKLKNSLQEKYTKEEIIERTNMNDGFQELKSFHIDQLQKLENDLFNIYKERMKKPIATYDELIERAKLTAKRGDFSTAQDYQLQAQYAKEDEEKKREDLFKEEYKARMSALLDKQSQELTDFGISSNTAINKLLKIRDEKLDDENERFKREMNRLYRKTCDAITHSRYNPRDPKQQAIDPKVKPSLLNRIEDTYNELLVKFGIQSEENSKKPKLIAPNIRPESKMSIRMQSRVEMRETEKKKKDEETFSRSNSKMSSRAASRSASKQTSPKQNGKTNYNNNNNTRRSVLSPSKF